MSEFNIIQNYIDEFQKHRKYSNLSYLQLGSSKIPFQNVGVFTKKTFLENDLIEASPLYMLEYKANYQFDPRLKPLLFYNSCPCEDCKRHGFHCAIGSGYTTIYAKDEKKYNAEALPLLKNSLIIIKSTRKIKINEEIILKPQNNKGIDSQQGVLPPTPVETEE